MYCDKYTLKTDVELSHFDDGKNVPSYLVSSGNRNWKVSQVTYYILSEMKDASSSESIAAAISNKYMVTVKPNEMDQVISFVQKNGLVEGWDSRQKLAHTNKHMWGRITIIPAKVVSKVRLFTFLFRNQLLIPVSLLCVIWLCYILYCNNAISVADRMHQMSIKELALSYSVVAIIGLFHEFGHASALNFYGQLPGRIGMGVYFIMPVFFSDVTKAWRLKRVYRIVVDLGGLYLQLLSMVVLFYCNRLFLHSDIIEMGILFSSLGILHNLNPFIRLDGYWVLCDYLGVTNLLATMRNAIMQPFRGKARKIHEIQEMPVIHKVILYLYIIAATIFFVYFISLLFSSVSLSVSTLYEDAVYVIKGNLSESMISIDNILGYISSRFSSFVVAIFAIRMVLSFIVNTFKRLTQRSE